MDCPPSIFFVVCVGGVRGAHESPGCKNGEKPWLATGPLGILVQELQQETLS